MPLSFRKAADSAELEGGPPGPRGTPWSRSRNNEISIIQAPAGRRGRRPQTRGSAPQFVQVFSSGKTKWHCALVRAASTLVSTPRGRCATTATAKLLLREPLASADHGNSKLELRQIEVFRKRELHMCPASRVDICAIPQDGHLIRRDVLLFWPIGPHDRRENPITNLLQLLAVSLDASQSSGRVKAAAHNLALDNAADSHLFDAAGDGTAGRVRAWAGLVHIVY